METGKIKENESKYQKLKSAIIERISGAMGEAAVKAMLAALEAYEKETARDIELSRNESAGVREENIILRSISGVSEDDMKAMLVKQGKELQFLRSELLASKKALEKIREENDVLKYDKEVLSRVLKDTEDKKSDEEKHFGKNIDDVNVKMKGYAEQIERKTKECDKIMGEYERKTAEHDAEVRKRAAEEVKEIAVRFNNICADLTGESAGIRERMESVKKELMKPPKKGLAAIFGKKETNNELIAEIQGGIDTVMDGSKRIGNLIGEYLKIFSVQDPSIGNVEWKSVVDGIRKKYDGIAGVRRVQINAPKNIAVPAVRSDRDVITQILNIFMQNAMEAVGQNGGISIRIHSNAEKVAVEIEDNGRGVKENERKKLFGPFYTTKSGHNGLGLAYAERLAEKIGAKVSYRPLDQGSSFSLEIAVKEEKP
ncbi:MAG: hypothetical protein JW803_01020 [Endomicrobiales bacterium]|nr:hypothetical protein [Endomicrobiales bacterium]